MTSIRVWREELAPFVTNFFSFSFLLTSRVNADRATDQKYPPVIFMIEEPSKQGSDLQKKLTLVIKKIKSNLHPTYIQGDADQREIFLKPCSSASHWSFAFHWTGPVHWLVSSARPPQTHNMMSAHQKYKHTVCACTEKTCMYPWADRTFSKHERNKMRFSWPTLGAKLKKKKSGSLTTRKRNRQADFFLPFFKVQIIPEIHLVDRSRQTIRAIKQKASQQCRRIQI